MLSLLTINFLIILTAFAVVCFGSVTVASVPSYDLVKNTVPTSQDATVDEDWLTCYVVGQTSTTDIFGNTTVTTYYRCYDMQF